MKPVIYIAGPVSRGWLITNIRNAVAVADRLAKRGCMPYVPHTHGALWELILPRGEDWWLEHGLAMVPRCDGVYRMSGESSGADAELALAAGLDIPRWYEDGGTGVVYRDGVSFNVRRFAEWLDSIRGPS